MGLVLLAGLGAGACSQPQPSVVPTPTPDFVAEVKRSLAGLSVLNEDVSGSISQGTASRSLAGAIATDGSSTQVQLVGQSGSDQISFQETIATGRRYVRTDAGPWVDHGATSGAFNLLALVRTIDVGQDQGRSLVDGHRYHLLSQSMDALTVARALGFETSSWEAESGSLRVWADDEGRVMGIGTSIVWTQPMAGSRTECHLDMDGLLGSTEPATIVAPTGAWRWIVDQERAISLALPASWAKTESPGSDFAVYQFSGGSFSYARLASSGSLDAQAASILGGSTPPALEDCYVAGEAARCAVVTGASGGPHIALDLVSHSSYVYAMFIQTPSGNDAEAALTQILSTVELAD